MKTYLAIATTALFTLSASPRVSAHCQVPCGIYSDDTVLIDLQTHQATIEKAMSEIVELSKEPGKNANQVTRWVVNKEEHANKIQEAMTQYFLAQRIKPEEADSNKEAYLKKITLAHQIIVLSMKCKQGTDVENAKLLKQAIDAFTKTYEAK
jgi:nickel superoxide dismutase